MNLSQLAAKGNALDLAIAEAQGKVKVKKLRPRKARKNETWGKTQGGGRAVGTVKDTDSNAAGVSAGTNGSRMTLTKQRGYGAQMVSNLDRVVDNYKRVVADGKKAEARARAAEREANCYAELDTLLEDIRG